ncbi:MAG: hypothetical protein IJ500_04100 [Alphaproteobacteria bacterium]|nr:hypothetical protein [Alphaproteobacteria bacterium]
MKKILIFGLMCNLFMAGNVIAGTHDTACKNLFPDVICSAYSEESTHVSGNACSCTTCPSTQPDLTTASDTATGSSGTYYLYNQCACVSCKCSNNPDTSKTNGECSCVSGAADYSTCTTGSSGGGSSGGGDSSYELCSSTNQCRTFSATIDGQIYCLEDSSTATSGCNGSTGVQASYLTSKYCSNYKGVDGYGTRCVVVACQSGYVVNDARTACTSTGYSCGVGYYGTATGANNEGCTACTSAPTGAQYTTENSCAWECSSGYYSNGSTSTCTRCPNSSTLGWLNSELTSYTYGTTATSGATAITECYLKPGTFYDSTGTFELTGNCSYVK